MQEKIDYVNEQIKHFDWTVKYHETELKKAQMTKELYEEQLSRLLAVREE